MRVITGDARGRKLVAPDGLDTRPTTDLVKESVFSIIQFDVPGARVLDLFAGSGQMGVEALSRGAAGAVFVDNAKAAVSAVKKNLELCGFSDRAKVYLMDSGTFLASGEEKFDIALLDPPYHQNLLPGLLPKVAQRMDENSIILCETQRDEQLPETVGGFRLKKQYRYGKILVRLYRNEVEEE